jgi:hypothetical protein
MMTEAQKWEERYLLEALKFARLLLAATERELELFRARVAEPAAHEPAREATG